MSQQPLPFALEVRGLTKVFDRPAVDALDLTVRAGEFYALLGPNGAGKTTTLRMVAGLLRPDAGSVRVLGIDALADPVAAKQITAWVSDEPMIYDKLTLWNISNSSPACGVAIPSLPKARRATCWRLSVLARISSSVAKASPRACVKK